METYEVSENKDVIMVIYVPMAKREQKPVYINNAIFNGTFRRDYEGDYHCTRLQVKTMLRDQTERTMDKEDGKLHPTAAGMLMFGDEYNIVRHFPEYFLDYREELDPTTRWSDRLQSSSGEWSGNVCDFYFRVYNKIIKEIKVPFKMVGGERIDDTPVHKALMKMFNLINIGERAGSGVPNIFNVWADEGWEEPVIEERFDPNRTILSLSFKKSDNKKPTIKSDDKKVQKQVNSKKRF